MFVEYSQKFLGVFTLLLVNRISAFSDIGKIQYKSVKFKRKNKN